MQFLPNGPDEELNHSLIRAERAPYPEMPRPQYADMNGAADEGNPLELGRLLRKYWLLLTALVVLGSVGGFISVVLSSPMYRSRAILEVVQNSNSMMRNGEGGGNGETSDVDIQTQVNILHSGRYLKRGADRVNSDGAPLAPTGRDIFSRLRQQIHP